MAHAEGSIAAAGEAVSPRRRSLAASCEAWLAVLVEIPAALLVVAEIVILFAGVVARYGLRQPLIWSDELASILFLWLAMLGAASKALNIEVHNGLGGTRILKPLRSSGDLIGRVEDVI